MGCMPVSPRVRTLPAADLLAREHYRPRSSTADTAVHPVVQPAQPVAAAPVVPERLPEPEPLPAPLPEPRAFVQPAAEIAPYDVLNGVCVAWGVFAIVCAAAAGYLVEIWPFVSICLGTAACGSVIAGRGHHPKRRR